jgi:O-antigen ligase
MNSSFATFFCVLGIVGLFAQERDRKVRFSWALWIAITWLFISGSRHVSEWRNGLGGAMSQEQYLEGSPLDAIVYGCLILIAICVLIGRKEKVVRILQGNIPIVVFVLYCAISVMWSDYPVVSTKRWIKSLGDYSVILVLLTELNPMAAVTSALARVSFLVLPLSILFIKYYPQLGRTYASHWEGTQFYVGICDNKNMLGMVCMIFGFAGVSRILQVLQGPRRGKRNKVVVHGAMVVLAIWLLKLSDSKTSLACFVLTSGLVIGHSYFRIMRNRTVLCTLTAFVIGSSFGVLFLGIGSGALNQLGRNSTLTGRTDIWAALFSVPINPVLGTGFESFWLGERLAYLWTFPIVSGITEAHNGYLEMYLNLGMVGLMLLGVVIWTGFRRILLMLERSPDDGRLSFGFFLIALIYNFTEAGFRSTDLVWISFILAAGMQPALLTAKKSQIAAICPVNPQKEMPLSRIF